MIYTRKNLPKSFTPYNSLTICSNTLIEGGYIITVGEVLPLIIGKGNKPQIWIQALKNAKTKEFILIVENSVSQHPAVKVLEVDDSIVVSIQGIDILSIKQKNDDFAVVDSMDLRPIGLNLYGNSSSLSVGDSKFSGNTMQGGGVLIAT